MCFARIQFDRLVQAIGYLMRSPSYAGQFKHDVKLAEKRGKDMGKLRDVIDLLLAGQALPRELGGHPCEAIGSQGEIFTSNPVGC